jgi:septum formation protein
VISPGGFHETPSTSRDSVTRRRLILASSSPRRLELLSGLGLDPEVIPSHVPEVPRPGERPEDYVVRLAIEKGTEVGQKHPDAWTLSADTVVVLGDRLLEKPVDEADARSMLSLIAGETHTVFTGVALQKFDGDGGTRVLHEVVRSSVTMIALSDDDIGRYVATGEPMDKAGAYAVQGVGAMLIESINGSYTNVVGLPLATVFRMLRQVGIDPLGAIGIHKTRSPMGFRPGNPGEAR